MEAETATSTLSALIGLNYIGQPQLWPPPTLWPLTHGLYVNLGLDIQTSPELRCRCACPVLSPAVLTYGLVFLHRL